MKANHQDTSASTKRIRGSFLIELLLTFALISMTITVVLSTFVNAMRSHHVAVAQQELVDAVSFFMEDMTREARVSNNYWCRPGAPAQTHLGDVIGCGRGAWEDEFSMTRVAGVNGQAAADIVYTWDGATALSKEVDGAGEQVLPPYVSVTTFNVKVHVGPYEGGDRALVVLVAEHADTPAANIALQTTLVARDFY